MGLARVKEYSIKTVVFIIAAVLVAISMNNFFVPNNIFSGGFNGVAQLISLFFDSVFGLHVEVGAIIMATNIPLAIAGWIYAGREFTILSFLNNFAASFMQIVLPKTTLVTHEPILAGLFGGLLLGISIGLTFKVGFSTGGMDIVAMIVQKTTGKSIGSINMFINVFIVVVAGAFIGWQNAMYTIIGIYATSAAVDAIHTRHQKLTAFIVTTHPDEVIQALQAALVRGITVMPSRGAFTQEPNTTLMMVLSRYELTEMQNLVKSIDHSSFINIVSTVEVSNNFWNEDLQSQIKRERVVAKAQITDALNISEEADKIGLDNQEKK